MNEELPEDLEDAIKRAHTLDFIRDGEEHWVAEEMLKLWENPDLYEDDPEELYEVPDGVDQEDYVLFRLAVVFGTQYEHAYPRGGDWRDE